MRPPVAVTIESGPDAGKTFLVHEMPAVEAELWCIRALNALIHEKAVAESEATGAADLARASGPDGVTTIAAAKALTDPQLDGIWKYITFRPPNPQAPEQTLRDDHIQDWRTRMRLRFEFYRFHTGFFSPENPSTSASRPNSTS